MVIIKNNGCKVDLIKVKNNYSYLKDALFFITVYLQQLTALFTLSVMYKSQF